MTVDRGRLPYRPCVGVVLIDARGLVFAGQRLDSPSPAWLCTARTPAPRAAHRNRRTTSGGGTSQSSQ